MTTQLNVDNINISSLSSANLNVSAIYTNNYYYANGTPFSGGGGGGGASTPAAVSDQLNTSTGYFSIPTGNTAQRPGSAANGYIRYNTTTFALESYLNGSWITIASN